VRVRFESHSIESSGLVERELACRLLGCALGDDGAALVGSAPDRMDGERFQVDAGRRFECTREVSVVGSLPTGGNLLDDGLADAIVTGFDDIAALSEPDANESFS
jgi:hypothetical protein